jgi:hypothetical protein
MTSATGSTMMVMAVATMPIAAIAAIDTAATKSVPGPRQPEVGRGGPRGSSSFVQSPRRNS